MRYQSASFYRYQDQLGLLVICLPHRNRTELRRLAKFLQGDPESSEPKNEMPETETPAREPLRDLTINVFFIKNTTGYLTFP